jgi:hypothetical protein
MMLQKEYNSTWSTLRFVIGSSGSYEQAVSAVQDLVQNRLPADSISILAKQKLLPRGAQRPAAVDGDAGSHTEFDLLASHDSKIACFGHTLGSLLHNHVNEGSKTLKEALQRWLLPRHAGSLSDIIENDGTLIWVEIHCPEEERAASLSLLRNSRGTVEAHDFVTHH